MQCIWIWVCVHTVCICIFVFYVCVCVYILYVFAFLCSVCVRMCVCVCVCMCVCVCVCPRSFVSDQLWQHPAVCLNHYPTKRNAHHTRTTFPALHLSEWWIALMFKVTGVEWTQSRLFLTSLTSCCTSTSSTYLKLRHRKSNSASVNKAEKRTDSLLEDVWYFNVCRPELQSVIRNDYWVGP